MADEASLPNIGSQGTMNSVDPNAPASAPSQFSSALNNINPVSLVTGAISKTADLAANQANQNTSEQSFQGTTQAPAVGGEQLKQTYSQLPAATKDAVAGVLTTAELEQKYGVPAAEAAIQNAKQIVQNNVDTGAYIQNNLQTMQQHLQNADSQMKQWTALAQTNPTQAVLQKSFGDHPIMSTIAMVLGGIGSGLTGQPNAAMAMLNTAIEGAKATKAEELTSLLNQSALERGISQDLISASQAKAIANNLANIQVLNATTAMMGYTANKIGSEAATARAQVIINTLKQQQLNSELNMVQQFKDSGIFLNHTKTNALGNMIDDGARNAFGDTSGLRGAARGFMQRFGLGIGHGTPVKPKSAAAPSAPSQGVNLMPTNFQNAVSQPSSSENEGRD